MVNQETTLRTSLTPTSATMAVASSRVDDMVLKLPSTSHLLAAIVNPFSPLDCHQLMLFPCRVRHCDVFAQVTELLGAILPILPLSHHDSNAFLAQPHFTAPLVLPIDAPSLLSRVMVLIC